MGFHPALEQPTVSLNNKFNFDLLLTSPQAPQQPKQPAAAQAGSKPNPYYSHKNTACLCAWFIMHLFACPEYPPTSSSSNTKLPYFIAYALHWTKLHLSVTFAALVLLQWFKARLPLLAAHQAIVCLSQCSWPPPRWSVMTPTLTSPGRSLARACSSSGRSIRWSVRCTDISTQSSTLSWVLSKSLWTWSTKTLLGPDPTPHTCFRPY